MKKDEIKIGKKYAIRMGSKRFPGNIIRPEGRQWVVVLDPRDDLPEDPVSDRTERVYSAQIIAPWTDYCIDSAHDAALAHDRRRTEDIAYRAKVEAEAKRKAPFIEALQGITVPGAAFTSSNVELPDVDLADKLTEVFVDQTIVGTSVTFDVFEALAREILDLRRALLDADSGWSGDSVDTGIAVAALEGDVSALDRIAALEEDGT